MNWRDDLWINARRTGLAGAIYAWLLCPGFKQVMLHRWSSHLRNGNRFSRLLSVILWRSGVESSGCYIAPQARIGHTLYLPHPIGIVIGEGTRIGDEAVIYQHVTLGVSSPENETYPTVGDRVMVYSGATIAGGITIGDDVIIGANSVVTHSIPSNCIVAGVPARVLRQYVAKPRPNRPNRR